MPDGCSPLGKRCHVDCLVWNATDWYEKVTSSIEMCVLEIKARLLNSGTATPYLMEQALLASACGLAVALSHSQVFKKPKQLIVHTSRGVPNVEKPPCPLNPCSKCKGTGKITCGNCNGVGTR